MTILFGRLRLNVTVAVAIDRKQGWEELTATGLDDRDLAHLNRRNTASAESALCAGQRFVITGRSLP